MYSDSTYPQSQDKLTEFLSEKQHDHRLHLNHVQRVVTHLTPLYNAALESPDEDTIKVLAMNYLDVIESLNVEHEALKSQKPDSIRMLEEGFRQYHVEMQHAVSEMIDFLNKKPSEAALMKIVQMRIDSSISIDPSEIEHIVMAYIELSQKPPQQSDALYQIQLKLHQFVSQSIPETNASRGDWLSQLHTSHRSHSKQSGGGGAAPENLELRKLLNPQAQEISDWEDEWRDQILTLQDLTCKRILAMTIDCLTTYHDGRTDQAHLHLVIKQMIMRFQNSLLALQLENIDEEDMINFAHVHLICTHLGLSAFNLHVELNAVYNGLCGDQGLFDRRPQDEEAVQLASLILLGYQTLSEATPDNETLAQDVLDAEQLLQTLIEVKDSSSARSSASSTTSAMDEADPLALERNTIDPAALLLFQLNHPDSMQGDLGEDPDSMQEDNDRASPPPFSK